MRPSIAGNITVSVTGADLPGTLDQLVRRGVEILRCGFTSELEATLLVRRRNYGILTEICQKRGDSLSVESKSGLYWTLKAFSTRPLLLMGLAVYLLLTLYLPNRVLFVHVTGNERVPARQILETAADCGIGFGASRREVRSEKMKNALLEALPQLQWAGVNTDGCVAEISVRERSGQDMGRQTSAPGHIAAARDGIILSATATRGSLLCAPGQAVAAGDILISGFTDCGLKIRAEQAEGEIFAATGRKLTVIGLTGCLKVTETGDEQKKISLLIGKKRINLWKDSGFWEASCDRMYEENYITLPGGFQLPLGWSVERFRHRELQEAQTEPQRLRELLAAVGESCLHGQMVAGTIRKSELSFAEGHGFIKMTGEYRCEEMIGFPQRLEIGDTNGKSD